MWGEYSVSTEHWSRVIETSSQKRVLTVHGFLSLKLGQGKYHLGHPRLLLSYTKVTIYTKLYRYVNHTKSEYSSHCHMAFPTHVEPRKVLNVSSSEWASMSHPLNREIINKVKCSGLHFMSHQQKSQTQSSTVNLSCWDGEKKTLKFNFKDDLDVQ
jgi:hypothetical protein